MTALQLSSRTGDFVHNTQTMGTDDGFSHVSKKWVDKCKPLSNAISKMSEDGAKRIDRTVLLEEITFTLEDGTLGVIVGSDNFRPTEYGLGQLAGQLNVPGMVIKYHQRYNMAEEMNSLVNTLNRAVRREEKLRGDNKFIARCDSDGQFRAFLTDSFTAIPNDWILENIAKLIPGGLVSHERGDLDHLRLNVLIPDSVRQEEDSEYGGLLTIENSEVGDGSFSVLPAIFRAICMNGCIWDQVKGSAISRVHRGKIDLSQLRRNMVEHINKQIALCPTIVAKMLETRNMTFEDSNASNLYGQLAMNYDIPAKHALGMLEQWKKNEGGRRDMFGMIQGMTRQSQLMTGEHQFAVDKIAGSMLNWSSDKWTLFRKNAAEIDDAKLIKVLGLAS